MHWIDQSAHAAVQLTNCTLASLAFSLFNTCSRSRSIFMVPVVPPYTPFAAVWSGFMTLVDLIYTAYWVPLGVAFCECAHFITCVTCFVAFRQYVASLQHPLV
eukprot:scaffold63860_cov24-Tisochrysis_lutea.AAC.1